MTADEEKRMHELMARGDPAQQLSPLLPQRIAARLGSRSRAVAPRWSRAVLLGVALASTAGLGAALAVRAVRAPDQKPITVDAENRALAARPIVDPISQEAELLQSALESLRRHDDAAALRALDERARRFPAGALAAEARIARVRALLSMGRDTEAFDELNQLGAADLTAPLRLAWADALARHARCAEAMAVLQPLQSPNAEEQTVIDSLRLRCR